MKTTFLAHTLLPVLLAASCALTSCGDKESEDASPSYDGTVTWTRNAKNVTSTKYSSAFYEDNEFVKDKLIVTAAENVDEEIVSFAIYGLAAKGVGTYELKKGTRFDGNNVGSVLLGGSKGVSYQTTFAANAVNGTVTISKYDKAGQKLEGTFSFTGTPDPIMGATGTQTVTDGKFSFTRLR